MNCPISRIERRCKKFTTFLFLPTNCENLREKYTCTPYYVRQATKTTVQFTFPTFVFAYERYTRVLLLTPISVWPSFTRPFFFFLILFLTITFLVVLFCCKKKKSIYLTKNHPKKNSLMNYLLAPMLIRKGMYDDRTASSLYFETAVTRYKALRVENLSQNFGLLYWNYKEYPSRSNFVFQYSQSFERI